MPATRATKKKSERARAAARVRSAKSGGQARQNGGGGASAVITQSYLHVRRCTVLRRCTADSRRHGAAGRGERHERRVLVALRARAVRGAAAAAAARAARTAAAAAAWSLRARRTAPPPTQRLPRNRRPPLPTARPQAVRPAVLAADARAVLTARDARLETLAVVLLALRLLAAAPEAVRGLAVALREQRGRGEGER